MTNKKTHRHQYIVCSNNMTKKTHKKVVSTKSLLTNLKEKSIKGGRGNEILIKEYFDK